MAHNKEEIDTVVWTRDRVLADLVLVFFVLSIGATMILTVRTYFAPH